MSFPPTGIVFQMFFFIHVTRLVQTIESVSSIFKPPFSTSDIIPFYFIFPIPDKIVKKRVGLCHKVFRNWQHRRSLHKFGDGKDFFNWYSTQERKTTPFPQIRENIRENFMKLNIEY